MGLVWGKRVQVEVEVCVVGLGGCSLRLRGAGGG